jgi:hypothetical protein
VVFKNELTPGKRVELALKKEFVDKVPFTVFGGFWQSVGAENPATPLRRFIPQSYCERQLRNKGLCIVELSCFGYSMARPDVKVISTAYEEKDRLMIRTDYNTPVGNVYTIKEISDYTIWIKKFMFTRKEDYKVIEFILKNSQIFSDNGRADWAIKTFGEDVVLRGDFGFEPLQELITGDYFGPERFCFEWMDNRDEILKLYEILVQVRRKEYKFLADSPIFYVCYGGNVVPEIISPENFQQYYIPHYNEAAEVLHKAGKVLGCHFDANNKAYKDIIASAGMDIIEAFTPSPVTDMSMKDAREAWPDKVLWINFPSTTHLSSQEKIAQTTNQIIDEAGKAGLLIGITEDVPEERWWPNYTTIMDTIDKKFNIKY